MGFNDRRPLFGVRACPTCAEIVAGRQIELIAHMRIRHGLTRPEAKAAIARSTQQEAQRHGE